MRCNFAERFTQSYAKIAIGVISAIDDTVGDVVMFSFHQVNKGFSLAATINYRNAVKRGLTSIHIW